MNELELIATSAFGLESIVAHELRKLGYDYLKVENGRVSFKGDLEAIARCNLWLRSADRVLIKVGEFEARSFEDLFENTRVLPWHDWLTEDAEFPVEGKSINSRLFSVSDCQSIVKKAVVENLKDKYGINWFKENGSKYKIQISLLKDIATLTIDTSGPGLHKRGYRKLSAKAPLKETLAAAMIDISRWKADRVLIDPFCGSGTIPIEAALIGRNIAPGMSRKFIAEDWPQLPAQLWKKTREEAYDLIDRNQPIGIFGFDIDTSALSMANYHAREAGLGNLLNFQQQDVRKLRTRYKYGYLICNPPYGERLEEKKEVQKLYADMGRVFSSLDTWSFYILSSHPDFEKIFHRKADKKRKLYNGRIQCNYYQFYGQRPENLAGPFSKRSSAEENIVCPD